MNSFPLVSILIPNYNKERFLTETLNSVVFQTYPHWECIIVDDHSTDNSWQILHDFTSKDPRFRIFKRPLNRLAGGNSARNFAFEVSRGSYINWLDSDDVLEKENIQLKVYELESNLNLDFVFSDIKEFTDIIENSKKMDKLNLSQDDIDFTLHYLKGDFWIQTGLPMFRKDFLIKKGKLFDENIIHGVGQEMEFFIRLLIGQTKFKFCPGSILYYRRFQESYMTEFYTLSYSQKYLRTYLPYKLVFLEFLRQGNISKENLQFFRSCFNDMLLFLPLSSKLFWDLFLFGSRYNLFKGRFQGIKILIIRFLRLFKLY